MMEDFLYKQAPVIAVMGAVILWLSKLYIDERNYNKEVSTKSIELARESMTVIAGMNEFKISILKKIEDLEHLIVTYHGRK